MSKNDGLWWENVMGLFRALRSPFTSAPTPDQAEVLRWAARRATVSDRAADLSGRFIQNAFGHAAAVSINTLRPADPRTLQAIAQAAAVGWGLSSYTPPKVEWWRKYGGRLCTFTWPGHDPKHHITPDSGNDRKERS